MFVTLTDLALVDAFAVNTFETILYIKRAAGTETIETFPEWVFAFETFFPEKFGGKDEATEH